MQRKPIIQDGTRRIFARSEELDEAMHTRGQRCRAFVEDVEDGARVLELADVDRHELHTSCMTSVLLAAAWVSG